MHASASGIGVVAIVVAAWLQASATTGTAVGSVSFDDPSGDVYVEEANPNPADIVKLALSSDGQHLVITATLAKAPTPVDEWPQAHIAAFGVDTDLDATTGPTYFAQSPEGNEFSCQFIASVEPGGAASTSAAVAVFDTSRMGDEALVVKMEQAPRTPAQGLTYTGKVAYSVLGVRSGQKVRVSVKEVHDYGDGGGYFEPVLIALQ